MGIQTNNSDMITMIPIFFCGLVIMAIIILALYYFVTKIWLEYVFKVINIFSHSSKNIILQLKFIDNSIKDGGIKR